MIVPATENLPAITVGGTWEVTFQLWVDKYHKAKFNATGWTFSLVLKTVKTLVSGNGLGINPAEGFIVAELTKAETESEPIAGLDEIAYYLKMENAEGKPQYPLKGVVPINIP